MSLHEGFPYFCNPSSAKTLYFMKDIAILKLWEVEVGARFFNRRERGCGNSGKGGNISSSLK